MSAFKNNKSTSILVGVLVLLNIVCLSFMFFGHPRHELKEPAHFDEKKKEGSIGFMNKKLNLNKEQVQVFRKLKKEHRQESKKYSESIRILRKKMFSNIGAMDFDVELVTDSIAILQKELDLITYRHFSDLRTVCNEKQKIKFDKFIHELARSILPNHPRHKKRLRKKKLKK